VGPKSAQIRIVVSTVRACYVSRKVSDTGESNDDTGSGVVCPGWHWSKQAGIKRGGSVECRW